MTLRTPASLRLEHQGLHGVLARASRELGALGDEARLVARLMRPHAGKEEAFALPPLGLLAELAQDRVSSRRFEYVELAEKLIVHARIEEEVMYPAAILVGEYLKLKLGVPAPA